MTEWRGTGERMEGVVDRVGVDGDRVEGAGVSVEGAGERMERVSLRVEGAGDCVGCRAVWQVLVMVLSCLLRSNRPTSSRSVSADWGDAGARTGN